MELKEIFEIWMDIRFLQWCTGLLRVGGKLKKRAEELWKKKFKWQRKEVKRESKEQKMEEIHFIWGIVKWHLNSESER